MGDWEGNNYPQLCFSVGLSCQSCTEASARQLASVCKGLRGKAVGQLFVQIYPHAACAPMHAHFAECYRSAAAEQAGEAICAVPARKPAAMAAVA
jgi:hypothetical protein